MVNRNKLQHGGIGMKENKLLSCKCGRKFREHDWSGKKTYTQCWKCFIEDFDAQVKNLKK